ncbi:soluble lamin-associated protein of 75 kDa-like [Salvelinus namaycush]|uniref:Soluble lamin-associated protein of 75 kDa-like n=1 Tax=Salvelinus namaycush TaxID=8040 RepID=A0A8U0PJD3_SALNM|nr:soluble lamin-associated protein of 75 kDa-like [Salvelinus namaycush]
MEFPVDVLDSVRQEEEEQAAEGYMTQLRYVTLDKTESFTLPSHRKISIGLCNVGFVPIYGGDLKHKVMALFSPDDQLTAVALYLAGQWWSVEDILRTSDPSRTGLVKARSLGERIVLYILNRIVYRVGEMDKPEVPFLCHGQHDFAKLLWKDGNAVGFYSVKPKDSLCNNFVTQRYQLPVMDSIFVRKCHRGNGHGLQMLEDFVDSFKDHQLGLKYPLSLTMYKVCSQYLCRYPADQDLLWVVEGVGGPYQRENVASKMKALALKAVLHAVTSNGDQRAASLDHTDVSMEEDNFLDITEDVLVVNTPLKLIEALDGTPVATRSRCSGHKKRGREETEDSTKESQPLKMSRLEDAKSEPTNTAVEDGGQEAEGREGEESGEAEAAVAPEEEKMTKAQIHTWGKRIVKMNGELTDGQREEEEGEAVLENRTTEEDVEIEAAAKEEESIEAEDILEAAPVVPEGLAEAVEEEDPLPLVEEPASVSEEAPSSAEPSPAEPSLSGDVREEATPMEEGEEDTVVATPVASEGLAVVKEAASLPLVNEPASTPEEAPSPMEGEEVKREKEEAAESAVEEPEVKEKSVEVIAVDRSSKETLVQVRVADLSYQPLEEGETQPPAEEGEEEEAAAAAKEKVLVANDENKGVEEMENATTTEEGSESSDEGGKGQALWSRVSGSGPAAPKRTSKRLNRVVIEQDREQPEVTVEEEEKATTTEEEEEEEEEGAVEKSWAEEEVEVEEEEEQPPVIDQRALRRKSRPVQTPNKARGKQHGKI